VYRLLIISLILSLLLSCKGGEKTGPGDQNIPQAPAGADKKEVTLLYPEDGEGLLTPCKALIDVKQEPQQDMAELIRVYLATVPKGAQVNPFPERASLRALYLTGGARAVVDLDQRAFEGGGAETEAFRIYGIINTLCYNFPEIKSVKILVEGQERETLLGHVDIQNPIPPQPSMNGRSVR
jgi:hypothetical protein